MADVQQRLWWNDQTLATSSNYANAVSTPCNYVTDTSLVAWTDGGSIYYKRSGFGGTTGYAYKTKPTAAPLGSPNAKLTVFPNPADGYITVSDPSAMADRYSIKNLLGQEILNGTLLSEEQQIALGSFLPGNYLINFYKDGVPVSNNIFLKK